MRIKTIQPGNVIPFGAKRFHGRMSSTSPNTLPAPTILSIVPTAGGTSGGTAFTITGTNFVATPTVTIGGVSATSVVWVSSTSVTGVTGAHAAGAVNVVITNPDGQSATLVNGFTYDSLLGNLVSYWNMSELTSTRADSVGVNTLTPNNTPLYGGGPTSLAANFIRASTQFLSATNDASITPGDSNFSIAGWVYLDLGGFYFVSKFGTTTVEYALEANVVGNPFVFLMGNSAGSSQGVTGSNGGNYALKTWYFVACTYTSSTNTSRISVNAGTQNSQILGFIPSAASGTSNLCFGTQKSGYGAPMSGRTAAWGYWNKVLTTTEITFLYNSGQGRLYSQLSGTSLTNLVSFWNQSEASGNRADSVGSNTLTGTGSPLSRQGPVFSAAGGSASFVASSTQYLSRAASTNTGIDSLTTDFSIAAWINCDVVNVAQTVVNKGATSDATPGFWIQVLANGTVQCQMTDGTSTRISVNPTNVLTAGSWNYISVTFSRAGNMSVYINGALGSGTPTAAISGRTGSIGTAELDWGGVTTTNSFTGDISDAGFWSKVLTSGDVTGLYNSGAGKQYSQL